MRCYTFGNYYMSSIQQGIQAAHSTAELFVKYQDNGMTLINDYEPSIAEYEYQDKVQDLYDWAENHKTMVCLNGGNLQGLKGIETLLQSEDNNLPWASFYEDEESLGFILTNIAIIVPEYIYDTAAKIRSGEYNISITKVQDKENNFILELRIFDIKLIELLNSCQLAR